MNTENILTAKNLLKKYKGFELNIPELSIPRGFATALIGENGAGKTTLLNMMSGLKLDYSGSFSYFENDGNIMDEAVRERIGACGCENYFMPTWTINQIKEICGLLFPKFSQKMFDDICAALDIPVNNAKTVKKLSEGNKMKLMLATVLARPTDLLILDEPASPLDPLMRDRLNEIIREYLSQGEGKRSVFFSTHNIADMESVTDFAILMDKGKILEQGFVEDLKEKYVLVKGEAEDFEKAVPVLMGVEKSTFGFEGLCMSSKLDKLAGIRIVTETATLSQICVGIMKEHTKLKKLDLSYGK